jgi:septum formation protein
MNVPEIVLASNSPRRREILSWTGLPYTSHPADIDETPQMGELPVDYVQRLAENKAHVSANYAPFNGLVLAADTTVADGTDIIGKPTDIEDARRMLVRLRGRTHYVHSAIVISVPSKGIKTSAICSTPVKIRKFEEDELQAYLDTGDSLDKAGAYAIQHPVFRPVVKFSGCFASVMGLPLCHFERTLRRMGFGERKEIPYKCQEQLSYSCPIYRHVLNGEEVG